MQEVHVTFDFNAPQEKIFACVSDHATFLSTSRIHCSMKRLGNPDANGNGALREVTKGMLRFEEEISAFNAPHGFDYRILSLRGPFNLKLPFQHEIGRIQLHADKQKTRLVWISRFRFSVPFFGPWLERKIAASISETFLFFLKRLNSKIIDDSSSTGPDTL